MDNARVLVLQRPLQLVNRVQQQCKLLLPPLRAWSAMSQSAVRTMYEPLVALNVGTWSQVLRWDALPKLLI
jgi:hypothetical protein